MKSGLHISAAQIILFCMAAVFTGSAVALPKDKPLVARDDPLVKEALEKPLPEDVVELIKIQKLFDTLKYKKEADAVSAVIEKSMLLQMLGKPAGRKPALQQSMKQVAGIRQANDKMSSRVLKSFKMEILAEAFSESPVEREFFRRPDLYQGGEWTKHVQFSGGYFVIPVRVTYTATGGVWKLSGKLELSPARAGKAFELIIHGFEKFPFQPGGTAFWTYAQIHNSKISKEEFIHAIRGLKTGDYRLKTNWVVAKLALSSDPTLPYLFLGPDTTRWALLSTEHQSLYAPKIDPGVLMRDELKCLARADEQAGVEKQDGATPLPISGSAGRRAEPHSPFMQKLLKRRVSGRGDRLMESIALLSALNYHEEAERLSRFVELVTLQRALGKVSTSSETIETVLTRPALAEPYLRAIRTCVLEHVAQTDLPAGTPEEIVGSFRMNNNFKHEHNGVWSRVRYGQTMLEVPVIIRNMAQTGFLEVEFNIKLVSDRKDEVVVLDVWRTGGRKTRPHETLRTLATLRTSTPEISATRLGQLLASKENAQSLKTVARKITLYPFGDLHSPALRFSADRASWLNTNKYEQAAMLAVERADCSEKDNCAKAQSGGGFSNPYVWIVFQLVVALVPLLLIARDKSALLWARFVYAAYWGVVLLITLMSFVDRPSGTGDWSGIITFTLAFFAGMPWSSVLASPGGIVNTAVNSFFLPHDASLMLMWLAMAMNQVVLGFVAFWPKTAGK